MSVPAQKTPGFSHRGNPSSRNSEIRDPVRKSFTENPFTKPLIFVPIRGSSPKTPSKTPTADIQRRNATIKEYTLGSFCDLEDKENGKESNQKAVKLRSPATTPKGTKNFMSPTISAASKVSATPKKKILIERNESIRTSFAVPEPKNHSVEDSDSQLEEPILIHKECEDSFKSAISDDKVKKSVKFETISNFGSSIEAECEDSSFKSAISDDKVKKSVKFETVSNFGSSMEADLVNLDPTFKISPRPLSANLAPLDADPLMPPYDPKKNYLSPRPRFLHYKPNPRIEIFLKGKETRQLEDSFMLESDTEITEETQSDDSEKDSENISSEDTIEHEDENDKELQESEMRPTSISNAAPKSVVEAKGFRFRSKFVVACLLFIVLPWFMLTTTEYSPAIFKDLSQKLQHFSPDMTEIATTKFGMLAGNLSLWSASSYLNLCNGIQNLREVHRQSPLQFYNLTDLGTRKKIMHIEVETANEVEMWRENEDPDYEEFYEEEQVMEKQDGIEENGPFDRDEEDYKLQAEEKSSANEHSVVEEFNIHSHIEVETANEVVLLRDYEDLDHEDYTEETVIKKQDNLNNEDSDYENYYEEQAREEKHDSLENEDLFNGDEEDYELQAEERSDNNPHYENTEPIVELVNTPSSQPVVMEFPAEETVPVETETEGGRDETVIGNSENDAIRVEEYTVTSETLHLAVTDEKQNFPIYEFGGISLLLLLSLVAVAKAYEYRKLASSYSANQERMISKKMDPNCEVMSSRMWQTDVVTVRESCPSEMSSLQRSSSYNKKSKKSFTESEKQGAAAGTYSRRESLASSDYSTASPSYGSFTTFEKIPYKHNGGGEEEIVTPVRRSSRIRQQVTSP